MFDDALVLTHAIFAKTPKGQEEIQSKTLGLSPMLRRLLILVDGKRNGAELTTMVAGQDIQALMSELASKECVTLVSKASGSVNGSTRGSSTNHDLYLGKLPAAESRNAKHAEMAKNFMTNTVNSVFEAYSQFTLLKQISACQTTKDARLVYPSWADAMRSNPAGVKRWAEFQEKLAQVL